MNNRDLVRRAYRALCTTADIRLQGGSYRIDMPVQGEVVLIKGHVVFADRQVFFRVKNDGTLKRLRRFPKF